MTLDPLKSDILERLHQADCEAIYHDLLVRRFVHRDQVVRISLALAAIAAFIGCCLDASHPVLWASLAGFITLLATTVIPALKWNTLIPEIEAERLRRLQMRIDFENVWAELKSSGDRKAATKALQKLRIDNSCELGLDLPEHADLRDKAREAVAMKYNLQEPRPTGKLS